MEKLLISYPRLMSDISIPIPLEISEKKSLNMRGHGNPVSITETEANYIVRHILEKKYKYGYEVATGFGISLLAAGLGLKHNQGRLLSIDSYIEEKYGGCNSYRNINDTVLDSDGYRMAKYIIDKYDLINTVKLAIGRSPDNVCELLDKYMDGNKLDYVFIDAEHYDDSVISDTKVIIPHLNKSTTLFFHDIHCFTDKFTDFLINNFGKTYEVVVPLGPNGYNLAKLEIEY